MVDSSLFESVMEDVIETSWMETSLLGLDEAAGGVTTVAVVAVILGGVTASADFMGCCCSS